MKSDLGMLEEVWKHGNAAPNLKSYPRLQLPESTGSLSQHLPTDPLVLRGILLCFRLKLNIPTHPPLRHDMHCDSKGVQFKRPGPPA